MQQLTDHKVLIVALLVLCAACGGASNGDGLPPDGDTVGIDAILAGSGRIEGTVWAPGNGPVSSELTGLEIPVANALVVVSQSQLAPIPDRVHCQQCLDIPGLHTFADPKGHFSIANIPAGDYYVTVQKGLFRRAFAISLAADETLVLASDKTTLPATHDEATGQWIPRMAVALGVYDRFEDILAKMGMGMLNEEGRYIWNSMSERIDRYDNGIPETGAGTMEELVGNLDRMLDYHVIFIPCSHAEFTGLLQEQDTLRNIRDYIAAGGRLYVSDWSGEWVDNVFPEHIQLGSGDDTPAAAYDRASDSWNTELFGDADGEQYNSEDAEVVDATAHTWLDGQVAPTNFGDPQQLTNAADFTIDRSWNVIEAVHPVDVGVDADGQPVIDTPKTYVVGDHNGSASKTPLAVSYEPAGCGRVTYTTYHTTESGAHTALLPQERLMIYLIMEIGECVTDIVID